MWVLGGAGMKEMIQRMMDGDPQIPANVTYPPAMIAHGDRADRARPRRRTRRSRAPSSSARSLITPENAEQYYYPRQPVLIDLGSIALKARWTRFSRSRAVAGWRCPIRH